MQYSILQVWLSADHHAGHHTIYTNDHTKLVMFCHLTNHTMSWKWFLINFGLRHLPKFLWYNIKCLKLKKQVLLWSCCIFEVHYFWLCSNFHGLEYFADLSSASKYGRCVTHHSWGKYYHSEQRMSWWTVLPTTFFDLLICILSVSASTGIWICPVKFIQTYTME